MRLKRRSTHLVPLLAVINILCSTALSHACAEEHAPIKIGWIGPLSGDTAPLGVDTLPAMQIVFDEINTQGGIHGHPLQLVPEDDQYTTSKTLAAYKKLVSIDKVRVILTLTYGGLMAIAPLALHDGVLLIDPLDCDEEIAKLPANVFCVAKRSEDMGIVIAEDALRRKLTPVGILFHNGDPFMPMVAESARKLLIAHSSEVALFEGVAPGTTDFRPHLLRAKRLGVQTMFFLGFDEIGLAMRQARAMGLSFPIYGTGTVMSKTFREAAGDAIQGVRFPLWKAPRSDAYANFLSRFKARVGREPLLEISTIPSYDIASLLVHGLTNGGLNPATGEVNTARLKEHLYAVNNYAGLAGPITIDPDGATRSLKVELFEISGDSFQRVQR